MHESLNELNFGLIPPLTPELSAHERLKKKMMYNVVTTLALSFLIRSSSFLQIRRKTTKAWMILNFGHCGVSCP